MHTPMIELRDVSFAYPGEVPVIEDVSFALGGGRLCTLMGGNGCGKTTLLKLIAGLLEPRTGVIRVREQELASLSRRDTARIMSLVPQEHALAFPYSVHEVVLMGRAPHINTLDQPGPRDREMVAQALDEVGISHLGSRLFTQLSGGERQLCLIARALAQDTPIMLLDEPTSHLDFRNQIHTLTTLRRLVRTRSLLAFVVTHDPNQSLSFADEVLMLREGRIRHHGHPREVVNAQTIEDIYDITVREFREGSEVIGVMPMPLEES